MSVVFEYHVHDSWFLVSSGLKVYHNGMVICRHNGTQTACKISKDMINEIYKTVSRHNGLLDIKEIDFPPMLDGCINNFTFSDGTHTNNILVYNISYYREETEYIPAQKILSEFDEIAEILIKKGVKKSYFKLDISFSDDSE